MFALAAKGRTQDHLRKCRNLLRQLHQHVLSRPFLLSLPLPLQVASFLEDVSHRPGRVMATVLPSTVQQHLRVLSSAVCMAHACLGLPPAPSLEHHPLLSALVDGLAAQYPLGFHPATQATPPTRPQLLRVLSSPLIPTWARVHAVLGWMTGDRPTDLLRLVRAGVALTNQALTLTLFITKSNGYGRRGPPLVRHLPLSAFPPSSLPLLRSYVHKYRDAPPTTYLFPTPVAPRRDWSSVSRRAVRLIQRVVPGWRGYGLRVRKHQAMAVSGRVGDPARQQWFAHAKVATTLGYSRKVVTADQARAGALIARL